MTHEQVAEKIGQIIAGLHGTPEDRAAHIINNWYDQVPDETLQGESLVMLQLAVEYAITQYHFEKVMTVVPRQKKDIVSVTVECK